jgi:hypothetical protein
MSNPGVGNYFNLRFKWSLVAEPHKYSYEGLLKKLMSVILTGYTLYITTWDMEMILLTIQIQHVDVLKLLKTNIKPQSECHHSISSHQLQYLLLSPMTWKKKWGNENTPSYILNLCCRERCVNTMKIVEALPWEKGNRVTTWKEKSSSLYRESKPVIQPSVCH